MGMFCHFSSSSLPSGSSLGKPSGSSMQVGRAAFIPYIDADKIMSDKVDEYFNKVDIKLKHLYPRPNKYSIERSIEVGKNLVLCLKYENCVNYEGRKILVFKNQTLDNILVKNQKLIDPHFDINPDFIFPFARFEPTEEGLEMAIQLAKLL